MVTLAFVASIALTAPSLFAQVEIQLPWPEACSRTSLPAPVTTISVPTVGHSLEVSYTAAGLASKQVAIIVNGNGYSAANYAELVDHLVQQGFVTANAHRPANGDGGDASYVLTAIDEALTAVGLDGDPALRLALVGHSQGGRLILEAAALNAGQEGQAPIHALVALSPAARAASVLNAWQMPNYLAIYGSQDEDLDGYANVVNEAFRAYDQVGSEVTTTCNAPPCVAIAPTVDKTLVFAYGADHAGLIGLADSGAAGQIQDTEFLDPRDQICLTKAYTTAFLHWQLGGDTSYKGFIRDEWRPVRIASMKSHEVDAIGNPVGSPLRLYSEISPDLRKVIHNFQLNDGTPTHSASVTVLHMPPLTFEISPFFVRHNTGAALVGWPTDGLQYVRWPVPAGSTVGSTYTHLSIRIGQIAGLEASEPTANTPGQDLTVYLGIVDSSNETDLFPMELPYPDPYLPNPSQARSVMSTFRVPVADIQPNFDLDNVVAIFLITSPGSKGSVIVDSIEWHRDP